mmetsp:Transcript_141001/g.351642  ORF Transcript_141001/g.351642 Transcript_141001/m.351642 type:complete len:101 (-) Transcript_141001:59-361(-)
MCPAAALGSAARYARNEHGDLGAGRRRSATGGPDRDARRPKAGGCTRGRHTRTAALSERLRLYLSPQAIGLLPPLELPAAREDSPAALGGGHRTSIGTVR